MKRMLWLVFLIQAQAVWAQSESLPDPTRPAEYQETLSVQEMPQAQLEWNLTAIRISDTDRNAIVNGQIVRVGDSVGQARLLEIQPHQVILAHDDRKVAVKLIKNASFRKPASEIIKTKSRS